ncbi:MAG: hypothetical protein ACOVOV_19500, partial [Dolichospermum sp.]
GTIRLLEIINDNGFIEYECAVFGELGGLVASIGNSKLEDLDFSVYNHTYNLTNIVASWDNLNSGVGYCYPLIDYGTYSTAKKDWNYRTFRPAFFAKEYIDKIFANAGYTFDSTHLNTTRVKSWIIPHNRKELTNISGVFLDVSNSSTVAITGVVTQNINFTSLNKLGSFTPNGTNTIFTYSGSTITSTITYTFKVPYNNSDIFTPYKIAVYVNGIPIPILGFDLAFAVSGIEYKITASVTINNTETIYVQVNGGANISNNIGISDSRLLLENQNSKIKVQVNIGEQLIVNDSLPQNILQKDFLSSILKLSNLYVFEDADNDKLLKIEPFIDFYANAQ